MNQETKTNKTGFTTKSITMMALFAAILCISAYISIPLPIPGSPHITLFFGYLLTLGGYNNVWPLFGSANQLLAALVLIALAVFLKTTGRTGWTLYIPMFAMLAVTFTALVQKFIALVQNVSAGQATFLVDGLQLIVAILLMVLGVLVAFSCLKKLFTAKKSAEA